MPRESSKCRKWEKERRERFSEEFTQLSKLLPCYDPAVKISKLDILRNACNLIRELQEKISNQKDNKDVKDDMQKLQERIKKLLVRNEQLASLLKEAKITVPSSCGTGKEFSHLPWSNKITQEQSVVLQKKEQDKENVKKQPKKKQLRTKQRKVAVSRKKIRIRRRAGKNVPTSKCVIVLSQAGNVNQPCYIITNAPSNNLVKTTNSTVITNSTLLTTPLVSSNIKPAITSLGPGTLILANGTILPVIPQTPAPTILNAFPPKSTVIVVPKTQTEEKSTQEKKPGGKVLQKLRPKYCLTKTTQVNKVPIPALTSRYSSYFPQKTETKPRKIVKEPKKIEEKKLVEESEEPAAKKQKPDTETSGKSTEEPKDKPLKLEPAVQPEEPKKPPETIVEEPAEKVQEPKEPEPLEINLQHSELSNDIFASLQVPSGCQNPESTSPTAAFLLAFPLVSSLNGVKVTEVIEEENSESQQGTPTLLQIGTMDSSTKPTQSTSESLASNFYNLDSFGFFGKDISNNGFYASCSGSNNKTTDSVVKEVAVSKSVEVKTIEENQKIQARFPGNYPERPGEVSLEQVVGYSRPKKDQQVKQSYVQETLKYNQCNFPYDTTKVTTSTSGVVGKAYGNPLYTNSNNYGYNYTGDTNFNQNYYKKNDTRSYYGLNYESSTSYGKTEAQSGYFPGNYYGNSTQKIAGNSVVPKNKQPGVQNKPINWMTTPDNRVQTSSDYLIPPAEFPTIYPSNSFPPTTQTNYFNSYETEANRKPIELPLPPPQNDENQFSWSPTKIPQFLDPSHSFVSSTLPTLVGDLALNFAEQKVEKCPKKDTRRPKGNYENQGNFLSVSQLVEQGKNEVVPARTSTRRNSGNRSKGKGKRLQKSVEKPAEKPVVNKTAGYEMFCEHKKSSYSAEALMSDSTPKRQNYCSNKTLPVPSFLPDNIISYFPSSVELPQDNNYQNQNYQSNYNFTSFQNNSYTPNTFIPSSVSTNYLPTNSFVPEGNHHEFPGDNLNLFPVNKDNKLYNKNYNRQGVIEKVACTSSANSYKKPKKMVKNPSENLPGLEFPFLSMPSAINSPILPDDFHTAHSSFLPPPPTPYSKNPLYKQNPPDLGSSSLLPLPPSRPIQHPEVSPSVGTSLTNFNLSAIFPEINKGHLHEQYGDARQKNQGSRSYPIVTTSIQVPFGNINKPTFSFSYNNNNQQQL